MPKILVLYTTPMGFPGGSEVKASASNAGDLGSIPGSGRSPGEGNGNHSSILAWRIPWTEKPGRLQSTGSQRVGYNWVTSPSPSPCVPKDKNHSFGYSFTRKNHFVSWSISLGQWRHQCMTLQDIWLGLFKTKGSTGKWQSTKNVPGSHTHNTEHQQVRCFWAERNCGESLQLGEKVGTLRHLITLAGPEFQFCLPVAWSLRKFQFFDPMFPSIWNAVLQ